MRLAVVSAARPDFRGFTHIPEVTLPNAPRLSQLPLHPQNSRGRTASGQAPFSDFARVAPRWRDHARVCGVRSRIGGRAQTSRPPVHGEIAVGGSFAPAANRRHRDGGA
jgi:hypothetical protein